MTYLLILMMIVPLSGVAEEIDNARYDFRQNPNYWQLWEPIAGDGDTFEYGSEYGYATHYIGPHTTMNLERPSGLLQLLIDFEKPVTEYAQSYEYFIRYDCYNPDFDTIINRLTWDGPKGTAKSGSDAYASSLNVTYGDINDKRFGILRKLVSTFCRREHNSLATEYYKLITEVNYRAKAEIQPEKWEDIEFHRSMECGPYEKRCDEPRYRIYGSKIEFKYERT